MKKTYSALGWCIYCGTDRYASDSNRYLAEEHIIPYGLNGELIILEASCRSCEQITGRQESIMLKGVLQGCRAFLGLRTRRNKNRPKVLPLFCDDPFPRKVMVEVQDYPAILMFLTMSPAGILGGPQGLHQISLHSLHMDINLISRKYGIKKFGPPRIDTWVLCRMLAKIAHSYAVAELGRDSFSPYLVEYIISKETIAPLYEYIGGIPEALQPSLDLHEIGIHHDAQRPHLVIVRVRLFAKYGGPTYLIVAGEKRAVVSG